MDLRREFAARLTQTVIGATSILNGAFADMLAGQAPIVLKSAKKILYWGDADQQLDFTSKDDVARYTAAAALDASTRRYLRIAGDVVTPRSLSKTMTTLTGKRFGLLRPGDLAVLNTIITVMKTLAPQRESVFPIWRGMQYRREMSSGAGKLRHLDNDRYGAMRWTDARDVLAAPAST